MTLAMLLPTTLLLTSFVQAQPAVDASSMESAWQAAEKDGTPEAYLAFYKSFPQSPLIKVATGTLRGRYWRKLAMPFDSGKGPLPDGVVVTVEGMDAAKGLSLNDARRRGVIVTAPATRGSRVSTQGETFNYVYFEATGGAVVVGDQTVAPRDLLNTTVIISADGKRLLGWDTSKASEAAQPFRQSTIKAGADGNYPCGTACSAK
jgi:hypothetical protein